jgi:HlyD family secretion protein
MIRRILWTMLTVGVFLTSAVFLYRHSSVTAEHYQLATPVRTTIVRTVVATGMIVPRREVKIKPQISGVIDRILVQRGEKVKRHDLLAVVEPFPNPLDVSAAETHLRDARVRFEHANRHFLRIKTLYQRETITRNDYDQARLDFRLAEQNLAAAKRNVEIIKTGASKELGRSASEIRATIGGMVLERPIEIGTFVIESNTFNEGTTIVTLADMTDLIFKGQVDEPDAGCLEIDMPLALKVGALPEQILRGRIEFIAPKAEVTKEGRITFEIRAGLEAVPDLFVRAGYSATAEIVIARREQVLAIPERYLSFKDNRPIVFVETAPQSFDARPIQVGLSDGLMIEVKDGLQEDDRIGVGMLEPIL